MFKFYLLTSILLKFFTGLPEGVKAVDGFEAKRFLGTWYEIARLDHRFERGLEKSSATYLPGEDGGISVINKGWSHEKHQWKEVDGKAFLIAPRNVGRLKMSFGDPIYAGYNIIELDKKDYSYSVISGPNKSYLWILSRTKQLPQPVLNNLIDKVKQQGFITNKLIYVDQN
jgi:apolipoprotein D and lipocalin family protein